MSDEIEIEMKVTFRLNGVKKTEKYQLKPYEWDAIRYMIAGWERG